MLWNAAFEFLCVIVALLGVLGSPVGCVRVHASSNIGTCALWMHVTTQVDPISMVGVKCWSHLLSCQVIPDSGFHEPMRKREWTFLKVCRRVEEEDS